MPGTGWKDVHFKLLCRIDDICRQYDINMCLVGPTAYTAYRNKGLSDYVIVGINARDVKRFIEAAEKENLPLKGMFNHYRFRDFNLKAYDPDTIDFDINRLEDDGCYGLYVIIEIIGNCTEREIRVNRAGRIKTAFKNYIYVNYDKRWKASHRRLVLYNAAGKVLPREKFSSYIFNKILKVYDHKTENVVLGGKLYPAELFENTRKVDIYGRSFDMPAEAEKYFSILYGIDWKNHECATYKESSRFRDSAHSWEEFLHFADYLDFSKYDDAKESLQDSGEVFSEKSKEVRYNTDIMIRTHLRFILWQRYYPMKDELIRLHKDRKYDELKEILYKYLLVLERTAKYKMTVCFDPEIFDIAMDVLRYDGRNEIADLAEEFVPPEHRSVIRIKDYKGEYI